MKPAQVRGMHSDKRIAVAVRVFSHIPFDGLIARTTGFDTASLKAMGMVPLCR